MRGFIAIRNSRFFGFARNDRGYDFFQFTLRKWEAQDMQGS
jgi:hypothetical protein